MRMFLFSRLAGIKSSTRITTHVKRFCWANDGLIIPKGLRIRYFIPRTDDVVNVRHQKDSNFLRLGYKMIYEYPHKNTVKGVSYVLLIYTGLICYYIYNGDVMLPFVATKEEEVPTVLQELEQEDVSFSKPEQSNISSGNDFINKFFRENPRIRFSILLAMLFLSFVIRSRIVLKIYRYDNQYVTIFWKPLSFNEKFTLHGAKSCYHYSKRKLLQYELLGKHIAIFPEHFINDNEKDLYIERYE